MGYNDSIIEKEVVQFLINFQNVILARDYGDYDEQIEDIQEHYENQWNRVTEKYYKSDLWPKPEDIAEEFSNNGIDFLDEFRVLYTELYYRHAHAKVGSNKSRDTSAALQEMMYCRFKSWDNYVEFFNKIINTEHQPYWHLPPQWLWDIMDEFIYQFGQYRQYRSKMGNKSADEIDYLKHTGDDKWNIHSVLNVLHSIVDKSQIEESLAVYTGKNNQDKEVTEFGHNLMYKYLGYFSLIGLLRFHVLIGDYQLAITSIEAIPAQLLYNLKDIEWFITTNYYYGFALLMMKRYQEAINILQRVLNYIERTLNRAGSAPQRTVQYKIDQQEKRVHQLYELLAICSTLYPCKLDDSIEEKMRAKVGDEKLARMADGEEKAFEDIYGHVAPKFVPLGSPHLDSQKAVTYANAQLQKRVFMCEVRSQLQLPAIRRYLKLYTTMELPKLTSFLSKNQDFSKEHSTSMENATLSYLMTCKVKMALAGGEDFDKTCPSTSKILNAPEPRPVNEDEVTDDNGPSVDFYVDGKMVHIADTAVEKTYGKSFLKLIDQYHKYEDQASQIGKK